MGVLESWAAPNLVLPSKLGLSHPVRAVSPAGAAVTSCRVAAFPSAQWERQRQPLQQLRQQQQPDLRLRLSVSSTRPFASPSPPTRALSPLGGGGAGGGRAAAGDADHHRQRTPGLAAAAATADDPQKKRPLR